MHDLAHAVAAGGVGQADDREDVGLGVVERVGDGVADVDLGGEVEHDLGPDTGQQFVEVDVEDVGLDELGPTVEVVALAVGEVVHDDH